MGQVALIGTGLLGEIPHIFSQSPFSAASLGVLRVFTTIAGIDLDFSELERQSHDLEQQLTQLRHQLQEKLASRQQAASRFGFSVDT